MFEILTDQRHNSHEHFLLGVTGIPDFLVNLWDWQAISIIIVNSTTTKNIISSIIRIIIILISNCGNCRQKPFSQVFQGELANDGGDDNV